MTNGIKIIIEHNIECAPREDLAEWARSLLNKSASELQAEHRHVHTAFRFAQRMNMIAYTGHHEYYIRGNMLSDDQRNAKLADLPGNRWKLSVMTDIFDYMTAYSTLGDIAKNIVHGLYQSHGTTPTHECR